MLYWSASKKSKEASKIVPDESVSWGGSNEPSSPVNRDSLGLALRYTDSYGSELNENVLRTLSEDAPKAPTTKIKAVADLPRTLAVKYLPNWRTEPPFFTAKTAPEYTYGLSPGWGMQTSNGGVVKRSIDEPVSIEQVHKVNI